MTTGQWIGVIGAATGVIVGMAGGVIGTLNSLRHAKGPREKHFLIRASIVCWVSITIFIALLVLLPMPARMILWIPYALLLTQGINYWNRTQQKIRDEESQMGA
jgi:hypothetical protein